MAAGLGALRDTKRIIVKDLRPAVDDYDYLEIQSKKYEVLDTAGKLLYYGLEDTSNIERCFYGEHRPFCIRVLDPNSQQLMLVTSDVNCCTREVTVELPPGQLAVHVKREFSVWAAPSFYIIDPGGSLMFKIKSPMSALVASYGDVNFDILSSDQKFVEGQISKPDQETFDVTFPEEMEVSSKAILLAVTFVLDFEFYEVAK